MKYQASSRFLSNATLTVWWYRICAFLYISASIGCSRLSRLICSYTLSQWDILSIDHVRVWQPCVHSTILEVWRWQWLWRQLWWRAQALLYVETWHIMLMLIRLHKNLFSNLLYILHSGHSLWSSIPIPVSQQPMHIQTWDLQQSGWLWRWKRWNRRTM